MTSAIQPAPEAAERLLTIGETTRIVGADRRVILAAMNADSLRFRSIDGKVAIALRDALAFRNSFNSFIRRGENRPASRNEGHRYGC